MDKKITWCLICTPDYAVGAMRTAQQLKYLGTKYDINIIALGNSREEFKILQNNNLDFILKPCLETSVIDQRYHKKFRINKIYAATLADYDLVCCIDVDIIFYKNLDYIIDENLDLLETQIPARYFDCKCGNYNSFLFLMQPKLIEFDNFRQFCLSSNNNYDAGIYKDYFTNYLGINTNKLIPACNLSKAIPELNKSNLFATGDILHFYGPLKYWNVDGLYVISRTATASEFNNYINKYYIYFNLLQVLAAISYKFAVPTDEEGREEFFVKYKNELIAIKKEIDLNKVY